MLQTNQDESMLSRISEVHQIASIQEREECLRSIVSNCGQLKDIISYRDYNKRVDIFLMEFYSPADAHRSELLFGFPLVGQTVTSLTLPSNLFH
jgi:hypothetical protein